MGKRIIIAEQDFDAYESMREYLSNRGHNVSWAKTGQKALEACDKETPDLFFIDALAPEVSGLMACKRVKEKFGDKVKCVIISELEGEKKPDAVEGVDAFFAKPVDLTRLARLMRDLTGAAKDRKRSKPQEAVAESLPVEEMEAVTPEGNIASTHLPRVLAYYCLQKANGCLILSRDKISKRVYLRGGQPVYITSNIASESLGRYLLSQGNITLDQYSIVLERVLESGKKQGMILIEMGLLSPHTLYEAMEGLAKEKIIQTFSWESGSYKFKKGKFKISEENLIRLDLFGLILDGIRRHYNLTRLEPFFQHYKRYLPQVDEPGGAWASALKPVERKFLSSIDGKTTMGKLVSGSKLNLTETFRLLFFATMVEGIGFSGIKKASAKTGRSQAGHDRHEKSQDLLDFQGLVERTYDMLADLDYFQILGISEDASANEVRSAYMLMTKQFRPYELHRAAGQIVREKADRIFERLTDAYETLLDETGKQEYFEGLAKKNQADLIEQQALKKAGGKKAQAPKATAAKPKAKPEAPAPKTTAATPVEKSTAPEAKPEPPATQEVKAVAPEATAAPPEVAAPAPEGKPSIAPEAIPPASPEPPTPVAPKAAVPEEAPPEAAPPAPPEIATPAMEPTQAPPEAATPAPVPPSATDGKMPGESVLDAIVEAAETMETAKLNVEPEAPSKQAAEEVATPPAEIDPFQEEDAASTAKQEESEIDIFAEPSHSEQELDFDLFEIGVDERTSAQYEDGLHGESEVNKEDDWLSTDSSNNLEGILEEGARITSDMANFMKGELKYQQGEHLMEDGEFAEAAVRFEEAIAANPNEAEYHAFFGWSIFNASPEDASNAALAIEKIQMAISLNPTLESAHYFLGRIAMHGQQYPQAKAHFEKALQYNPTYETASQELIKLDNLM